MEKEQTKWDKRRKERNGEEREGKKLLVMREKESHE